MASLTRPAERAELLARPWPEQISPAKLASLLGNLPGMAFRFRNDRDRTAEFVSTGAMELTGYPAAHFQDPKPAVRYLDLVRADDKVRLQNEVQSAISDARPYTIEYRINTAQGVEKWVWERGVAVRGPDGEVVAIEGFVADITVRRRMENELRAIQARLQAAEQRARVGSWEWDFKTGHGWCSAELFRMFGLDPARGAPDINGFLALVHPEDRTRVAEFSAGMAEGGGTRQAEFRTNPERGPVRHMLATIESTGGTRLAGTTLDITERKRADEEIRASEHLRRLIIDNEPECVKLVGPDGGLMEMNPA